MKTHTQKPDVIYKSISLGSISTNSIELLPVFEVANKNSFPIKVDEINYALTFNSKKMLSGKTSDVGTLQPLSKTEVPVGLMLTKETFKSFQQLLMNSEQLDYSISGDIRILGFSIPFEEKNTFFRPNMKLENFNVTNASFDKLSFVISLLIENKNNFSIPLNDMSYKLVSGKQALLSGEIETRELGKGESRIDIPLTIKPSQLFNSIFSLFKNPELPLELSIDSPLHNIKKDLTINLKDLISP